jgi:hypothetical protein
MAKPFETEIGNLTNDLKNYLNLRLSIIGLILSKHIANLASFLLTAAIITALAGLVILMLSFAFVFWYGASFGTYYQGFLILALVYTLLGWMIYWGRKRFFIDPIVKKVNEKIAGSDFTLGTQTSLQPNMTIEEQILSLSREADQCEDDMKEDFDAFTDQLHPINLAKRLMGNMLTNPTMLVTLLNVAIKLLRKSKNSEEEKE